MPDPETVMRPGQTLGILGGGQLARMLAIAAAPFGLRCHIYDPDPAAPAADVSAAHTIAGYDDAAQLSSFAAAVDVVTYEFENVPTETARLLSDVCPVRPGPKALEVAQDRAVEKTFLGEHGIETVPWRTIDTAEDIGPALAALGGDGFLKTRRLGYDGKGQARIRSGEDPAAARAAIAGRPAVLEQAQTGFRETSVILARGLTGETAAFTPGLNTHRGGILRETQVPGGFDRATEDKVIAQAAHLANALGYVGIIGVEFFVLPDGTVRANEFAPRVHNTGHWTLDTCPVSQFAQHVRAVAGWPLASTARHSDAVMTNLIGHDIDAWQIPPADAAVHLYGKLEARPGRKMGHVTRLSPLF